MAVNGRSSPLDSQYWAYYLLCAHLCRLINPTIRSDIFVNFGRRNSKPVQRRSNVCGLRLSPHTFLTLPITSNHPYFTVLEFTSYYSRNVIVGLYLYHFRASVDSVTSHRIELRARWVHGWIFWGDRGTLGLMQMQMQMQMQTKPKGALQTCTSVHVL
jgi:hypothetical protein